MFDIDDTVYDRSVLSLRSGPARLHIRTEDILKTASS